MISGGQILWNAIAVCEMTKTSWQKGKLRMKDDLVNPSGTCFARGWTLGRRYSDCWDWRFQKLDASEICPRRLNAKEALITQKDGECVFPVADGSAKLSGRDYEFQEPTLRRESTVRWENLSGESHGDREDFRPEETKDDEGINKVFFGLTQKLGKNFMYRHHLEPRSSTDVPREESFLISKICIFERNSSEKKKNDAGWELEKSQQGRTEFCTLWQLCARLCSDEKISRKLFTWNLWRWKHAHVVSSRSTSCLWDKNSSSNPKNPGSTRYSQVWTWEENSLNSGCGSAQRTWESRVTCG